jgi:hypothetical protein
MRVASDVRPAGLALLLALPAPAASLKADVPRLQLRLEALGGQPTSLLGTRAGLGLGAAFRLTDQVSVFADGQTRPAPGGGIHSLAVGLSGTLDITPVEPYIEVAVVTLTNRAALGYSLAARTGAGADLRVARAIALGVVARTYAPFNGDTALAGFEAALRLSFTPGAR